MNPQMKDEASRLRIAKAFRGALARLKTHQNWYICVALEDHHRDGYIGAKAEILRRLGDRAFTAERWLQNHHPDLFIPDMRKYRIAWLNELVKEFDPEGKTAPNSK